MVKKAFISYRREDTAAAAGRLYDRLCRLLSKPNVFFDVSTIAGGEDFEKRITSTIEQSDAVLVMIGSKWLQPAQDGKVRLLEANDYVRAEVRAALTRAKSTLPILIDGAHMPRAEQLPDDVRAIATRNAMPLRHASFDDDAENIITTILGTSAKQRIWETEEKLGAKIGYCVAGAMLIPALLVIGALVHFAIFDQPLAASIGDSTTALVLILSVILGGWFGLAYEARLRRRRLRAPSA